MNPYVFIVSFLAGIGIGMYLDHEFQLASQVIAAYQQVNAAQAGETALIKDTQTLNKDIRDAKDPCLGAPVPGNINKLLR